ncbi:hypothetical protein pb186bvf_009786 [Paramecium bursaria]
MMLMDKLFTQQSHVDLNLILLCLFHIKVNYYVLFICIMDKRSDLIAIEMSVLHFQFTQSICSELIPLTPQSIFFLSVRQCQTYTDQYTTQQINTTIYLKKYMPFYLKKNFQNQPTLIDFDFKCVEVIVEFPALLIIFRRHPYFPIIIIIIKFLKRHLDQV